jgi:hypothetical protein
VSWIHGLGARVVIDAGDVVDMRSFGFRHTHRVARSYPVQYLWELRYPPAKDGLVVQPKTWVP